MKVNKIVLFLLIGTTFFLGTNLKSQQISSLSQFRQLQGELPTPNDYRTASGTPGHKYWQQRADYLINIELEENKQQIHGTETIHYFNNSPEKLTFLWLQLDQNMREKESIGNLTSTGRISNPMTFRSLKRFHTDFDGGFKIDYVKDKSDNNLHYTVVGTVMRVDLPTPLTTNKSFLLKIKWWYNINDKSEGGRSGYEYFPEDDNYTFTISKFYPRMAAYTDADGWQTKQYIGSEFALTFGDYQVNITVPSDHIVGATGELQNSGKVLSAQQRQRLNQAETSIDQPVLIVTEEEANKNSESKSDKKITWQFKAKNVRDFAFASSRRWIWDAMGVKLGNRIVMAMSYFPKEGNPLWGQFSTQSVAHTIRTYSKITFDYPYPVAISVNCAGGGGMEYPMISFNGGRPEPDGTYPERAKYGLIGLVIHEVGHNWFPMIVNSDERQWAWMDEGFNTFVEYLSEQEWEQEFPSRGGQAWEIVDYMKGDKNYISPIMTDADCDLQLGNNAYNKTATGLNILRETILGRELFDFAFKEYSQRWMFKHPTPSDFFRTMEDASGVDLDWFWRGWFMSTDHVDIAINDVKWFKIDTRDPEIEKNIQQQIEKGKQRYITDIRNEKDIKETFVEKNSALKDFYDTYNSYQVTEGDKKAYDNYLAKLTPEEKELLHKNFNYYEVSFKNIGGMVMPLILEFEYTDGSKEVKRIPAEIWRKINTSVSKVFVCEKEVKKITLDPFLEMADVDTKNNVWTIQGNPDRVRVNKSMGRSLANPMQEKK